MRTAAEDCVIQTDSRGTLPVPKGANVASMINAMHHNRALKHYLIYSNRMISPSAKYWPDPYEFRPGRFLEDYNKDAFMAFSAGPRGCIGRRYVFHRSRDRADQNAVTYLGSQKSNKSLFFPSLYSTIRSLCLMSLSMPMKRQRSAKCGFWLCNSGFLPGQPAPPWCLHRERGQF